MNLRQLEAFQAVYTTGSVSLAAAQLNITQPAVSTLISNLEKGIGFPLFERIRGRLIATHEAMHIYSEVEGVFGSLERVAQVINGVRTMSSGHLSIASMPGATIKFFPQILASFLKGRSDVNVNLHTRSSPKVMDMVSTGQVDVGLAEMPVIDKAIDWEPFIQRCVIIMPKRHRLAKHDIITPADIRDEPVITLYNKHMVSRRLDNAFENAGLICNIRLEVGLFSTCCNLVHEGLGIALVDAMSADHHSDLDIISRPFEPTINFDIALLFPANRPRSKLTAEFSQLLKNSIQKYLTE